MSINVSKQKREELLGKIKELQEFVAATSEGETTGKFVSYLDEIARNIKKQRYGLIFEEHQEKIQEILKTHVPYLVDEKELRICNGNGKENFLIEGDNFASLSLLLKTHKEKIDLIIIDPPYNRGKTDFIYDDDYVDTNDTFKHSKWASFMYSRLVLARKLLSPEGYIFLNIDDNELTTLKMLCDDVFREQNFVGMYMWEKTSTAPALSKKVRKKLEYILCYAKSLDTKHQFSQGTIDGDDAPLLNTGNGVKTLTFPPGSVQFRIPDGIYEPADDTKIKLEQPVEVRDGVNVTELVASGEYKWVQNTLDKEIAAGTYFLIKSKKLSIRYQRTGQLAHKTPQNLLNSDLGVGTNEAAEKELKALKLPKFDYPKPTSLYTFLIDMVNRHKDITVLDFFAGSGTTGHAVLKKNKEDGGTRNFILCTNNEGNVCREITYERLKRCMENEGFEANLSYLKVEYLPTDGLMYYEYADELLEHIQELVELETECKLDSHSRAAVVLDEETEIPKQCKELYLGIDVMLTAEQEAMIDEHNIRVHMIPEYYYRETEE